jgi:hypothetical protein
MTTSSPNICTAFHTIEGDLAFGPDGEWTEGRPIWAQHHDIKGHDVEQFCEPKTVRILVPPHTRLAIWFIPTRR